ncbi:hypothetical protein [Phaeobacter gallaeciensis]|uniref:hypothetical protein n=1 Tax=Phaeobacter gallaeciensis TaxID=60890 RepID=UPI00237F47C8|nr:hypothetical protein [Phaeobacter gallaeciensis]MDE4059775.1 hypothetical protein [Phaeobacter gallaeciensis]MDE4122588.1 hypothetical protein [Phaeobacter gallaeciensis]MDE4127263.1 hypothetical protein [Phaeobacter gallaeciensis]
MSFSNPATAAEFFDLLPIQEVQLRLDRQVQINNLGGGEILQAELFPAMWVGSVSIAPMPKRRASQVQALLAGLEAPGQKFHAYKAHQIGPADDPLGNDLSAAAPVIGEFHGTDPRLVKFHGMPQGLAVSEGDFLAFDYDPGTGSRRAFHQVIVGRNHTQDDGAGGYTSQFFTHLVPPVRPGAQLGAAVEFVRPQLLAVLVPGSVSYGITRGNVTSGMSFDFRQTLKA